MAITVDWGQKIIYVPKADLEIVQLAPTEIRKLDLNYFRLSLKSLEESEDGMPMLDTHSHNPPVDVGGVTIARVVQIINGYTVTFEDGQYAVNLYGANSNVGDRVNVNQVSVRSSNSAGLVTSEAIEYGEYGGGVTVDQVNGEPGTVYPIGTNRRPVNNIPDAMLIAATRGFTKVFVLGNLLLDAGDNVTNMTIIGQSPIHTMITVNSGSNVINSIFQQSTITGTLDGNNVIKDCYVSDINYVNGAIQDSLILNATITLAGGADAHILDCWSGVIGAGTPTIDLGGAGQGLGVRNYNGGLLLTNKTGPENISLDINSGQVKIDSTVTNGTILIRGLGKLTDNSTGTAIINAEDFLNKANISDAMLNSDITNYTADNTVAFNLQQSSYLGKVVVDANTGTPGTVFPFGTSDSPVDNLEDALTIAYQRNLAIIQFNSDYTFSNTLNLASNGRIVLSGDDSLTTTFTFQDGCVLSGFFIRGAKCTGEVSGINHFEDVLIEDLVLNTTAPHNYSIHFNKCQLRNVLMISSDFIGDILFTDCVSLPGTMVGAHPLLDFNNGAFSVDVRHHSGTMRIDNVSSSSSRVTVSLDAGIVQLLPTVTSGNFRIEGTGSFVNNATSLTSLDTSALVSAQLISDAVWDETLSDHLTAGSAGNKLNTASSGGVDYDALASAVWDEDITSHTLVNSVGSAINDLLSMSLRILGLNQENFRFSNQVYSPSGNLLSGTIRIYPSSADVATNTNHIAEYTINAEYNLEDRLVNYSVTHV